MSSGVYRFFAVAYQRDGPPNSPRLDQAWTKTRYQNQRATDGLEFALAEGSTTQSGLCSGRAERSEACVYTTARCSSGETNLQAVWITRFWAYTARDERGLNVRARRPRPARCSTNTRTRDRKGSHSPEPSPKHSRAGLRVVFLIRMRVVPLFGLHRWLNGEDAGLERGWVSPQ